jgi:hypothetical protein
VGRIAALLALGLVAAFSPARARGQTQVDVSTGIIVLKDDNTAPIDLTHRYVKFKHRDKLAPIANQVVPPAPGSDGDPTPAGASGGGATFTVYNSAGSGEAFTADLPAARWGRFGPGYIYSDGTGTILKVYVRPYKLYVRGGGPGWGYTLDEPSQGRIAVRLRLGTGIEWCADAPPLEPASLNDRQDRFVSAKAPPPSPCPSLPGS